MMSQNRQAERDRLQSDYTARVNLRAELMTRHINAKLDALLSSAWRRLLESQAIQTAMLERLVEKGVCFPAPGSGGKGAHASHGGGAKPSAGQPSSSSSSASAYAQSKETDWEAMTLPVYEAPATGATTAASTAEGKRETTATSPTPTRTTVKSPTPPITTITASKSLTGKQLPTAVSNDVFSIPLAALCLAPPAARLYPGLETPWLLETEEDEHTIFLLRTMLQATCGFWGDDEGPCLSGDRLIFEHRLANFGDNFAGAVRQVRLEVRDPSLASRGVELRLGEHAGKDLTGLKVAPAYVKWAVAAASLVDTGGGAETWFPFDLVYDLEFTEGAVLDSILAGDGFVTLRNAMDLGCMTATGTIKSFRLHPRGCPCSKLPTPKALGNTATCAKAVMVINGEVPPRFKPSVSSSRKDRLADFWKAPLSRIEVSNHR